MGNSELVAHAVCTCVLHFDGKDPLACAPTDPDRPRLGSSTKWVSTPQNQTHNLLRNPPSSDGPAHENSTSKNESPQLTLVVARQEGRRRLRRRRRAGRGGRPPKTASRTSGRQLAARRAQRDLLVELRRQLADRPRPVFRLI
eukprot:617766-Prorocentrum_minimum.AAC.1